MSNLTPAVASLPTILTIRDSSIPEAGLGVFSNSQIPKGLRFGPYKGKKTGWEHITNKTNTSYVWEVEYYFLLAIMECRRIALFLRSCPFKSLFQQLIAIPPNTIPI